MYKWTFFLSLIGLLVLSGCMNDKDGDIAAIVRGEEITIGDMRLLYPDDVLGEMVDDVVKAKLAEQEVKKMNIDISKHVKEIEESYGSYSGGEQSSAESQSIRAFADPQAKKLDMDPHEYYETYKEKSAEMTAYINVYVSKILGGIKDDEFGIEEYHHHANEVLDDLAELNKERLRFTLNKCVV